MYLKISPKNQISLARAKELLASKEEFIFCYKQDVAMQGSLKDINLNNNYKECYGTVTISLNEENTLHGKDTMLTDIANIEFFEERKTIV